MKLKKYAFGIISGLALSGLLATTALADTVRLKLAGTYPVNHFGHEIVENMIKEIEDADVGVKISYFPASQLGSGEELIEDAHSRQYRPCTSVHLRSGRSSAGSHEPARVGDDF